MTTNRLRLCVAVGVLAVGALQAFADDWVALKSAGGRFQAVFPVPPRETANITTAGQFAITVHTILARSGAGEFVCAVVWNDYPPEAMALTTRDRILDNIVKGYDVPGKKVLSDKQLQVDGKPARAIEVDVGNGVIHRAQFVMVGNRLFNLMTYAPISGRNDPRQAKFFDGFSFWFVYDFPLRGFRIEGAELAGWTDVGPDKSKTAARWISPGSTPADVRAMIVIDAARGTDSSSKVTAQDLAANWGGTVSPNALLLDGEVAFKVEATNAGPTLRPVEGIVAMHRGFSYIVMGGVVPGQSCTDQVDQIIKGWKWERVVAPSERLDVLRGPVTVLGGTVVINLPKDMYANKSETPERALDLSLFDMRTNDGPFQAFVQLVPFSQGQDFAKTKDAFLDRLNSQKILDVPLSWVALNGDATRLVTAFARSASARASVHHDVYVKWALIKIDQEHMVLINFTVGGTDQNDRARYEGAAERIVDSVHAVGAGTQSGKN